jgi:hypothetical protein
MTNKALLLFVLLVAAYGVRAQFPPPVPIVEQDLRDNTIRMRSVELERIKRESRKPVADPDAIRNNLNLVQVRTDFENIQKLQDSIVKNYRAGRELPLIAKLAKRLRNDARRLMFNLFGEEGQKSEETVPKSADVRKLVIDLDDAIGRFVGNPIFRDPNVVRPEDAADAQARLNEIIRSSVALYLKSRNP